MNVQWIASLTSIVDSRSVSMTEPWEAGHEKGSKRPAEHVLCGGVGWGLSAGMVLARSTSGAWT